MIRGLAGFFLAFIFFASFAARAETGPALNGRLQPAGYTPPNDCDPPSGAVRVVERVVGGISVCESRYGKITPEQLICRDSSSAVDLRGVLPTVQKDLNWIAESMLFQEIGRNNYDQAICRVKYRNRIEKDSKSRDLLMSRAGAQFNQIKDEIKTLMDYRNELSARKNIVQSQTLNSSDPTMASSVDPGAFAVGGRTDFEKMRAEVDEHILRRIMTIPLGYEPEVRLAIEKMATDGNFDPEKMDHAMLAASSRYSKTAAYFEQHTQNISKGKMHYCLNDEFRHMAGKTGAIKRWIDAMPATAPLEKNYRDSLGCRLDAQYETGPARFNTGIMIAGFAGAAASMGAGALAEGGVAGAAALATVANVANITIDAVALSVAVNELHQDCFSPTYVISTSTAPDPKKNYQCDPESEYQQEVVQRNLSSCAISGVMTAAMIPAHILNFLRVKKVSIKPDADVHVLAEIDPVEPKDIVVTSSRLKTTDPGVIHSIETRYASVLSRVEEDKERVIQLIAKAEKKGIPKEKIEATIKRAETQCSVR